MPPPAVQLPLLREEEEDDDADVFGWSAWRKLTYHFLHPGEQHIENLGYGRAFCIAARTFKWLLVLLILINPLQAVLLVAFFHWQLSQYLLGIWMWGMQVVSGVTTLLFTAEYLLRLWTCVESEELKGLPALRGRWVFFRQPLNLLDFAACCALWLLLLLAEQDWGGGAATLRLVSLRFAGQSLARALLIGFVALGEIGQSSLRVIASQPMTRTRAAQVLEYDVDSDAWKEKTVQQTMQQFALSFTWSGASSRRRSAKYPQTPHDAFGFDQATRKGVVDPKTGLYFRILLGILAATSSLISLGVDRGAAALQDFSRQAQGAIVFAAGVSADEGRVYALAVAIALNTAMLWSVCFLIHRVAPQAAGSGLPEVKCILSGIELNSFLSGWVLTAKSLGLALVLGALLPVGKEGPFVHIASCVGFLLLESDFFSKISLPREDVLLAAVAVGVGATFSAPVSGVLFALELMMPRLYDTSAYAACFLASTLGTLVFMCMNMVSSQESTIQPLFTSNIVAEQSPTLKAELVFILLCVIVGAVSGTLGSCFVQCHRIATKSMNGLRGIGGAGNTILRDHLIFLSMAVVGALLQIYGDSVFLTLGTGPMLTELFSRQSMQDIAGGHSFAGELHDLKWVFQLFLIKSLYTVIALSLPIPAGVVAPSLVLGGLVGRLLAASMPLSVRTFLDPDGDFSFYAARFAIVGGTAFCGSVCRVNSVVVTVFELIAVPRLILPLMLATTAANYCGNKVGPSIFDSILLMKKIPAMPTLRASFKALQRVSDVLDPELLRLTMPRYAKKSDFARYREAKEELGPARAKRGRNLPTYIPIVEELDEDVLVICGSASEKSLCRLERRCEEDQPTDLIALALKLEAKLEIDDHILEEPLYVNPHTSLKQAYIEAQASQREGPMMVVEGCCKLVGILPQKDLLNIAQDVDEPSGTRK